MIAVGSLMLGGERILAPIFVEVLGGVEHLAALNGKYAHVCVRVCGCGWVCARDRICIWCLCVPC